MTKEKREHTSRRVFVREIAGAAFAGALAAPCVRQAFAVSAQGAAGAVAKKALDESGEKLVAPCGLYCGACPMYLATQENNEKRFESLLKQFSAGKMPLKREDLLCDGCIGGGRVASFCRNCAMRACAAGKSNVTRCSDCADVPCAKVTNFNNDGMLHHSEVLENLRHVREMGISNWTKYEEERWRCPQCKEKLSWYDQACIKCGAKRSDKLFSLKEA